MSLQKAICIVGPTGVGKTALAARLSVIFPFELLSADSVQVYKELNIVSGKDIDIATKFYPSDIPKNGKYDYCAYTIDNTPIYLLDLVPVSYSFNTFDFITCAEYIIPIVNKHKKIPCIVGGTGLYVQGLLEGLDTKSGRDDKLRKEMADKTSEEILSELEKVEPEKAKSLNQSEKSNKQHLIRYLEISLSKNTVLEIKPKKYESIIIGLSCGKEILRERINNRVFERIEQGAFDEAESMYKRYDSLSNQVKTANGYRQLFEYFAGKIDRNEAIQTWKFSEYKHAKNQMTWFKKDKNVLWFDIQSKSFEDEIISKIDHFIPI